MERRTIMVFRPSRMRDEVAEMIVEAGARAPTATRLQPYTIIQVRDEGLRDSVAKLCEGFEELIKNAAAIFLICVDLRRVGRMLDLLGHNHVLRTDKHPIESLLAVFDTALLVENMIMAAEVLGYGSAILDYPLVSPREFAELFKLPRGVTPFVLLCIGEKGESPPLRPRLPLNIVFQRDQYRDAPDDELKKYLESMEKAMEREGYVRKYAKVNMKYLDYLRSKTLLDEQAKKINEAVEKYIKENLLKF